MDIHLRDLRYFIAVAEELSFTKAAERLHLSQPALSKQIRAVERVMRAELFDRNRRQVRLTKAGEVLLTVARRMIADWDNGAAEVAEIVAERLHTLRVGTLTSIGRELYRGAVSRFATQLPDWRIELRSFGWGDPTAGLRERTTDAAFLWLPVDTAEISCQVLLSERRCAVVSREHRLAHREAVSFRELAGEPFVALPRAAGPLRDFWLGADEGREATVRVVAEVTNADEKLEVISSGAAIGLIAESNTTTYARPDLVYVPVTDLGPARFAVARRRGDRRPAVEAFIQACAAAARHVAEESGGTVSASV